jgi:hypothetical protein
LCLPKQCDGQNCVCQNNVLAQIMSAKIMCWPNASQPKRFVSQNYSSQIILTKTLCWPKHFVHKILFWPNIVSPKIISSKIVCCPK